jgi:hypothetical protein
MRALALGAVAGLSIAMAIPAAASDAVTTRIETRPFYGATVTLEEGVRVFRPLPRHDRIIINPNGQTPVSLGYVEQHSTSINHFTDSGSHMGPYRGPAYYGTFGNVLPHGHRHGHHVRPNNGVKN